MNDNNFKDKFKKYLVSETKTASGFIHGEDDPMIRLKYHFPNGFGASVIRGPYAYGDSERPWEVAIIKLVGGVWRLYSTYDHPDVDGYLNDHDVGELLEEIKNYDSNLKGWCVD